MKAIRYILFLFFATLVFQSCSWIHRLLITNTTDMHWQVEYELNDLRGIFRSQIFIQDDNFSTREYIRFEGDTIRFEIAPKQTMRLGIERVAHYKIYKNFTQFDEQHPHFPFINVDDIRIFNDSMTFAIKATELEEFLSRNSRNRAVIDIGKVIENYIETCPQEEIGL